MLEGIKRDSLHWGIQIRNSKEAKVAWGMQVKGRQTGDKIRQAKDVGYIIFDILSQYKDCVLYCLWTGKLRSSEQRGLVSTVQLLSYVLLFATPWTAARQASLSITNSQSPPKLMSIESESTQTHVHRVSHPNISFSVVSLSSCPQSFPASRSFQMSQLFVSGGQSIGVSASASVLPMNTQGWSPLGWTGWNSLQSKGLLRVFSNTTVQKH